MKEYKFRGKSDDEWVYGMLLKINQFDCGEHGEFKDNKYMIQTDELLEIGEYCKYFITDDNSVGQYTGLHDKNGKEIYEEDIVFIKGDTELLDIKGKVEYSNGFAQYIITNTGDIINEAEPLGDYEDIEVIGNVFENKELLNETNR